MSWLEILKLAKVNEEDLALSLIEVILKRNNISDYTPKLLK
tara:strand:- start:167 stop:289 length:123 start_codon:yes stop_codon:yes gene_type:complete